MASTRILIIEDEEIVRDSMVRVLQRAGMDTEGVASGEEALSRMESIGYHLLLVDLRLPGINGLEVVERARRIDPYVGALMITGYGSLTTTMAAMEVGILGFVLKPIQPEELLRRVRATLEKASTQRDLHRLNALRPLLGICSVLASDVALDKAIERVAALVGEECQADRVFVSLIIKAGTPPLATCWGTGSWEEGGGPAVSMPISRGNIALGTLTVSRENGSPPFGQSDNVFLALACNVIAMWVKDGP
ncbi:MAG: response regulator, partial [Chloroflexi bacterium]|nr:response regulator [Chloroflexota bacterium]